MDRKISLSVSTHNGKRKNNNEDSFSINHKAKPSDKDIMNICGDIGDRDLFLGVFDGMGGEKMGDVASRIAAERAAELYKQLKELTPDMFQQAIDKYVNETNAKICITLENCGDDRGGTTMAAVFIKNGMVYPFSIGDSRIYLLRGDELIQISEDHTLAMRKYKSNIYTLEEAEASPDSHKLTLFLGVDVDGNGLDAQFYEPFLIPENGCLLICSDGLYDMCSKSEIVKMLQQDSENTARELAEAAVDNGGIDNVTCIVAKYAN